MIQTLKGKVVSNKMKNTVVVEVVRLLRHPMYGKYMKRSKRYKAHTTELIPEGSVVIISSTKPISKDKKWKVNQVIKSLSHGSLVTGDLVTKNI